MVKDVHLTSQPSISPMAFLNTICIILYDSLPVDDNIQYFLRSIYEAKNLLAFCTLFHFSLLRPPDLFDWKGIYFWLSHTKAFTTYKNDQKGILAFQLKVLLDILLTLTMLQKCKPFSFPSDWLYAFCHSTPEDLNHLWTCLYIIPDTSSRSIYHKLVAFFRNACIENFSEIAPLLDLFKSDFSALTC